MGTFNVHLSSSQGNKVMAGVMTLYGVDQTNPRVDSGGDSDYGSGSASVEVDSQPGDLAVDVISALDCPLSSLDVGEGQTSRWSYVWNNPNWGFHGGSSTKYATDSSVTLTRGAPDSCDWGYIVAVFRSAANATPTPTETASSTPTITPTVPAPPSGIVWRSYYFAGAQRVAMRVAGDPIPANNGVFYVLGDHLRSTNVIVDEDGDPVAELRYKAWGETRYSWGSAATHYRYTGQREEASFGLYYYRARWYDGALGRFAQADTITPGSGPMAWDRYAYGLDNPVRYADPTGHKICDEVDAAGNCWNPPTDVPLTHAGDPYAGKKRKYGGDEVAAVFGLFQLAYGADFSLEQFVGMYVWREGNIHLTEELLRTLRSGIAQCIAQQLFVGADNPAYNMGSSVDRAAVFNMIAAYIQPAHEDIDDYIYGGKDIPSADPSVTLRGRYLHYGSVALSRANLVNDSLGAASQWGNRPEWTSAVARSDIAMGQWDPDPGPTGVYFWWDTFFIISVTQREYWNDNH